MMNRDQDVGWRSKGILSEARRRGPLLFALIDTFIDTFIDCCHFVTHKLQPESIAERLASPWTNSTCILVFKTLQLSRMDETTVLYAANPSKKANKCPGAVAGPGDALPGSGPSTSISAPRDKEPFFPTNNTHRTSEESSSSP